MKNKMRPENVKRTGKPDGGFSMIEVVICMALSGFALLGLAQLFSYSVLTNVRADRISNATFLAQQQIDHLRSLTADELMAIDTYPSDEILDLNSDGNKDYRRITKLDSAGQFWRVKVLVFSGFQNGDADSLLADPQNYRVFANIQTLIAR